MSDAYRDTLASLYARTTGGIKLGLETVRTLLRALGSPEHQLGRTIVVAGTNGKGSTASLIASALTNAGYRAGFYSSPHLLRFTERIRVDNQEIADVDVPRLYAKVLAAERACDRQPTFFECATAMALLYFAEARVEATVLEVGLGGRLDATNAVAKDLAVITPVDFDHQAYLGHKLELIAAEKAGIISKGGTVVLSRQQPAAREVILDIARNRGAEIVDTPDAAPEGEELVLRPGSLNRPMRFARWPKVSYQHQNVATAVTAVLQLRRAGLPVGDAALASAIADFSWPGRYQRLATTPETILDGAHNPAGARALVGALADDPVLVARPIHAVFGAMRDKDTQSMLALLSPKLCSLDLCPLPWPRSLSADELKSLAPAASVHPDISAALQAAQGRAAADGGVVLVTGSLLLVGAVLGLVTGAPADPPMLG